MRAPRSCLWLLLLAGGCVSFRSVQLTAELGFAVERQAHTLDEVPTYCRLLEAAGTKPAVPCDALAADTAGWCAVAQHVGRYSRALSAMAADRPPSLADDLTAATAAGTQVVWRGVTAGQASALGHALDALFQLFTATWRRRLLSQSITAAATPLDNLIDLTRAHLRLQLDNLTTLDAFADATTASVFDPTPLGAAGRAAMVHLGAWLRAQRTALEDYDHSLMAFAMVHRRLAASAAKLYADDGAVYQSMLDQMQTLQKGAQAGQEILHVH